MADDSVALHILYGIPCVGKSTSAVEFAHRHNIRTVIHTDYIREIQRNYRSPEQDPALAKVTHNAWELHGPRTRPNIEAGFVDHVNAVRPGIRSVVKKLMDDGFDAVIEGVHFHGDVIKNLAATHANARIHAALLIVRTTDELQHRIAQKENDRAKCVARKQWRQNLPVMFTIQDFLIADAREHGISVATPEEWRSLWIPVHTDYSTSITS